MCSPNWSPYSKSNSSWPDFSTGIASTSPRSFAWLGMSPPNCSSTSTPVTPASAPFSVALSMPSKIRCFASAIRSVSSGVGSPSIPNIFFWKDPRWSKARMYSFPS